MLFVQFFTFIEAVVPSLSIAIYIYYLHPRGNKISYLSSFMFWQRKRFNFFMHLNVRSGCFCIATKCMRLKSQSYIKPYIKSDIYDDAFLPKWLTFRQLLFLQQCSTIDFCRGSNYLSDRCFEEIYLLIFVFVCMNIMYKLLVNCWCPFKTTRINFFRPICPFIQF